MNIRHRLFNLSLCLLILLSGVAAFGQRKAKPQTPPKSIIFAVLNDGETIEPIAYASGGKLSAPIAGGSESNLIAAFNKTYYKPKTAYQLFFGGFNAGTVVVTSSDPKAECSANMATVKVNSDKANLKGFIMGLATNLNPKAKSTFFRRRPTAEEKAEADELAKGIFIINDLTPKELKYHNLTAINVDNDDVAELVGSYWIVVDKVTRGLLFLIAEKTDGKYTAAYSEFRTIDQENTMGGDILALDDGVYHEMLLDSLDYTGDGVAEIFTYTRSFEGVGFASYKRSGGKWVRDFEGSNYHCAY